jgi:hypothetical protein
VGALPDVFSELEINFFLLRRLLGVRSKEGEKQSKVRGRGLGRRWGAPRPPHGCGPSTLRRVQAAPAQALAPPSRPHHSPPLPPTHPHTHPPTHPPQVTKLSKGEVLMLNIGSMCTGARVLAVKHDLAKLQLTTPVSGAGSWRRLGLGSEQGRRAGGKDGPCSAEACGLPRPHRPGC